MYVCFVTEMTTIVIYDLLYIVLKYYYTRDCGHISVNYIYMYIFAVREPMGIGTIKSEIITSAEQKQPARLFN